MNQGYVYLVGAGCGREDLITVRGLKCLQSCDVVVYDDLIAEGLLEVIPKQAEIFYMGKREGCHSKSQGEISQALVELALQGKRVVRLKGGDPFVFGRGGEEILALKKAGIPYEEVPGISSSIAIPAEHGIPVTHRGISRSFHVITAHTADTEDGLPAEFDTYASLSGTLVFLMGLKQLPLIAKRLMKAGMKETIPAAVVSGGNSGNHKVIRGTLVDITEKAKDMTPPAIILVGETTEFDFSSTIDRPLFGVSVAVTGTDAMTKQLKEMLWELGADVITAVRSVLKPLEFQIPMNEITNVTSVESEGTKRNPWIVFTSGNGVDVFFEKFFENGYDMRRLYQCKFAVIGDATRRKLASYGIQADLCPEVYTSEGLADAFCAQVEAGASVYLFRSAKGSKPLKRRLEEQYQVVDVPTYDIEPGTVAKESIEKKLSKVDYITFASSSGVDQFMALYGKIPEQATVVTIGEVTSKRLSSLYGRKFIEAKEISAKGLVDSIVNDYGLC